MTQNPYLASLCSVTADGTLWFNPLSAACTPPVAVELARIALWPLEGPLRPAGQLARAYVRSKLLGRVVSVHELTGQPDCEVMLGDDNLSDLLVSAGHARFTD
jgi:hypothetical protein